MWVAREYVSLRVYNGHDETSKIRQPAGIPPPQIIIADETTLIHKKSDDHPSSRGPANIRIVANPVHIWPKVDS